MKKPDNAFAVIGLLLSINLLFSGCITESSYPPVYRDHSFNEGWRFIRDSISGAELPSYDDSQWMDVDLPHDYSIMHLPGEEGPDQIGPFSKKSPGNGHSTGHVMGGTAWYRKSFTLDKADEGKTAILKFDGIYMESEVWVNGKQAGIHKNGYTPFWFDITPLLNSEGSANVIAVKVDNPGRNSRWYSGSGIYRNVHLTLSQPVHVSTWGVHVTTPEINPTSALVDIEVSVQNKNDDELNAQIAIKIIHQDGKLAGIVNDQLRISGNTVQTIEKQIDVQNPDLWSIEAPNLYKAEITVEVENKVTDVYHQTFGIRTIEFSATEGFLLNGQSVLLKGGCLHHDNGLLGAAAFDRAEERKVELMKASGYNVIRCAHNPPSEAFLNACDWQGVLVINEFVDMWEAYKNPQDYSVFFKDWWEKDLTDMMLRDRNHPSIIMWSIGNEVLESSDSSGTRIGNQLAEKVMSLDDTRVVTEAISEFFTPGGWENTPPSFERLDVGGYQYTWTEYESDHQNYPDRIMYGSESYPLEAYDSWKAVEDFPYVIGDFVWTSMDYLGEVFIGGSNYIPEEENVPEQSLEGFQMPPGMNVFDLLAYRPSFWPDYISGCGDIDITGDKKAQSLYRDVLWENSNLEIAVHEPIPPGFKENVVRWGWPAEFSHWSWQGNEGEPIQVRIFTRASQVRLELNGEVVGEKALSAEDKYIAVFELPYQPGELKAIALEKGVELANKILKTSGEPAAIRLSADRSEIKADRNDLAFVKIELVDKNGQLVPRDLAKVKLTLTGSGEIIASGSASQTDMESVNNSIIKTYQGKAQAIIRPFDTAGDIILKVESGGLESGELIIVAK